MFSPLRRALLLALSSSLLLPAGASAASPDARCFELRIYTAAPGKLDDLNARFRNHTLRLFEKHGITNVGYWVPAENTDGKLYYMLAYPSREARETSWKAFAADPDWVAAKNASEVQGKLVAKVEQKFMLAADFSPVVKAGAGAAKRVFEWRIYTATPNNLDRLVQRSGVGVGTFFKDLGIELIGAWTLMPDQAGADKTLLWLVAHPSAEAGKAAYDKLRADSKWLAIKAESEKTAGGPLTLPAPDGVVSVPLVAVDYSPTK